MYVTPRAAKSVGSIINVAGFKVQQCSLFLPVLSSAFDWLPGAIFPVLRSYGYDLPDTIFPVLRCSPVFALRNSPPPDASHPKTRGAARLKHREGVFFLLSAHYVLRVSGFVSHSEILLIQQGEEQKLHAERRQPKLAWHCCAETLVFG